MSDYARKQAGHVLKEIKKLIRQLRKAQEKGDDDMYEEVLQTIYEFPLDVSVRSGWQSIGEMLEPAEYQILLMTGGPAIRIVGDLGHGEPITAVLEYQDWYEPWQEYPLSLEERGILLEFARCFSM